jgi:excisionase family DNA binding protein
MKGHNPTRYIDINEVVELCNISKSTIRRNVQSGSLKCSQKLGKMLFKVEEVERWLNN